MECLKETKKRNSDEGGGSPKRRNSRRAERPVDFLREKAVAYREIRQQEFRAKQQEQESQQQMLEAPYHCRARHHLVFYPSGPRQTYVTV